MEKKIESLEHSISQLELREEQLSKGNLELTQKCSTLQQKLEFRDQELDDVVAERDHLLNKEESHQENHMLVEQFREKFHK